MLSPLVAFACAMLPRAREGNAGSLARALSRCTHLLLLSLAPCCLALGGQLILLPRAFVKCWQRHMQNSMPYPVCSGPDNRARQLCHSKSDAGSLRLCLSVSLFLCVSLSVSLSCATQRVIHDVHVNGDRVYPLHTHTHLYSSSYLPRLSWCSTCNQSPCV